MVEIVREDGLGGAVPPGFEIEVDDPALLEDPEVLDLIAKANESIEENPLFRYVPHSRQRIFHEHLVKTKAFVGGNRSGKSTATVIDCLIQAIDVDQVPPDLMAYRIWPKGTKFKCRFITPDYGKPFQSLVEAIQMWVPPSQLKGGSWETAYKDKDHILYFANGSVFDFMTTEQPSTKHGGSARHRIVWDEEPPDTEEGERIYTQARMRIADYHGDMLWGFTPISEKLGWVFDEIHEQAVEEGEKVSDRVWVNEAEGLLLVQASIYENPHLSEEGREDAIAGIRGDQRAAVTEGAFTSAKGLVWEAFEPRPEDHVHVVPESWIDKDLVGNLEHLDSIDPGQIQTAILFGGVDKMGRIVIYDELALSGRAAVPERAAETIATKREGWGLSEVCKYTIIDPAARSRDLGSGERVGEQWIAAGVPVIYGKHDLEAGCMEVERRLIHHIDGEDGKEPFPLLVISSRCTNLIRQMRKYRKKPKEDGSFGVVKKDDHACDALRYLCMERRVPVKRKRKRSRQQGWVPGTAPAYKPAPRRSGTVMGKLT